MSTHTPGPWGIIHESLDGLVSVTGPDGYGIADVEGEANARLIAVAPRMLSIIAALIRWDNFTQPNQPRHFGVPSLNEIIRDAREVYAEARGEA